jgi:hypothetical protein
MKDSIIIVICSIVLALIPCAIAAIIYGFYCDSWRFAVGGLLVLNLLRIGKAE